MESEMTRLADEAQVLAKGQAVTTVFIRTLSVAFLCIAWSAPAAHADETWTCTFVSQFSKSPMLVNYQIAGDTLIQTWATGATHGFRIQKNNQFGIVAISAISEIEPNQTSPTIGAMTFVLARRTKEFWLATTVTGGGNLPNENDILHGTCINK